jgi:hypothetical protein
MKNNKMPKIILNAKTKDERRGGYPRKRWHDNECGIESLGIRNWRLNGQML